MRPSLRLGWMIPAALSLLAGLDAALILLGFPAPVTLKRLGESHGMLLALGFVGTLVALERATALGAWWGYLAPALLGFGSLTVLADPLPISVGKSLLLAGAAASICTYIPLWRRRFDSQIAVQILGSTCATAAALMWLMGVSMDRLVPWITAFLILTIAAERVELAAITLGQGAGTRLLVHAWSIALALIVGVPFPHLGAIFLGVAYLALAIWLLRHDVARNTIRASGATRFMAACMLAGYFWLIVAAVTLLLGFPVNRPAYDTFTHAVLLGFTFSMIMAHSTTILPAVLHLKLPYRPLFWVPAGILHAGLVVRIMVGNLFALPVVWQWGGVITIAALVLFFLTALGSALVGQKTETERA